MKVISADSRIDECIGIRTRVFVAEQGVPPELEVDAMDEAGSPCRHFLIVGEDGLPFGAFRGYFEDPETVHLQRFCILKDYRGRGFGRDAFLAAARIFSGLGAKKLVFGAQCSAIGFYEKCGCRVTSGVFQDAGIDHRMMCYSIP